ncbi:hypothetical protein NNL21_29830 [Paenibacillus mendelii]|nr:hypothetical protein [Paenibacillus mendelii]
MLNITVLDYYNDLSIERGRRASGIKRLPNETDQAFHVRQEAMRQQIRDELRKLIDQESEFAGAIIELVNNNRIDELNRIFYS